MGCGGSKPEEPKKETKSEQKYAAESKPAAEKPAPKPAPKPAEPKPEATKPAETKAPPPQKAPESKPAEAAPAAAPKKDEPELPGKSKFMGTPVATDFSDKVKGKWLLLTFAPTSYQGLVFCARDDKGRLLVKDFTDAELGKDKDAQQVSHNWSAFFKSVASEMGKAGGDPKKGGAKVDIEDTCIKLQMKITSSKDASKEETFSVTLEDKPKSPDTIFKYLMEPMVTYYSKKKTDIEREKDREREKQYSQCEADSVVKEASIVRSKALVEKLTPGIRPLRENAASVSKVSSELAFKVASLERKIRRAKQGGVQRHWLDETYEDGGARTFQHLPWSEEHVPKGIEPNAAVVALVKEKFPLPDDADKTSLTKPPSNPDVVAICNAQSDKNYEQIMQLFTKIDQWDFNIFELDKLTNGGALFHVTYALFYKYNLVKHFNIDDTLLRNWLTQIQAGYHPNPYHNSVHAADVTQILHYILTPGGLAKALNLNMEDTLASIVGGCIHDYDHPGFNNNFHSRTAVYLSTLYNDRSILENHHLACVFEMFRIPKFNLVASLAPDKYKEVRDTLIEMVLSTDMGNHAKIFSQFRRRLQEGSEWTVKKDDIRLALSMGIKMADISNCGRPNFLYVEWAKNIATEFYNQGDVEVKLKLPISPFMDRRKDKTDFPKGQISFMNYIVVPMFEAISELVPNMLFTVEHCGENREYWQKQE